MTLRGRVVDELGKPIAWARVGPGPPHDPEQKVYTLPSIPFQRNTYTDASGLFTLNDVNEQSTHIWVNHPETGLVNQEVIPANDVIDIQVERLRLYSISGVVSLTGVPLERLTVRTVARFTEAESRTKMSRTDAHGTYRLEGLEPGEYSISVGVRERIKINDRMVTSHRTIQYRTLVIEDRDVMLNFEPLGDARITGVATYNGQPISDVDIRTWLLADDSEDFIFPGSTKTDQEGRFEVRDLPSERIAIRFLKIDRSASNRNLWSKTDTIDLTGKKELRYLAELNVVDPRDFLMR